MVLVFTKIMFSRICRFCRLTHELREKQIRLIGGVRYNRRIWHRPVYEDLYKRRILQGPEPERPRSVWSNWNYDAEVYAFGQRLGEEFNEATLNRAFLHRSYLESEKPSTEGNEQEANENSPSLEDNTELIEKGGDFLVTHLRACLRSHFPRLPEESVRSVESKLSSESQLAHVGKNIGVKDLILSQEFPTSTETLSDTFKAVVGALLTDQGEVKAGRFVQDLVLTQLIGHDINEWFGISDPMGLLVGLYAEEGRGPPEPRLLFEHGATTMEATFVVGMYSDKVLTGKGYGESVNIAEEMAARDALTRLFGTSLASTPMPFDETITLTDEHYKANVSISHYFKQQQLQ